jgi:esterase/lipase superfamily enzyme
MRLVSLGWLVLFAMLSGCAPRGQLAVVPEAEGVGSVQRLLVASSRQPLADGVDFGREPGPGLSFAEFDVSVPPDRSLGTVTLPDPSRPDPRRDFLVVDTRRIDDGQAFVRAVNTALAAKPAGQKEVFVFVHGFNTNFAEGIYRQAQMREDFRTPGVSIHYSWPSAARATSYATDREAVLLARDDLDRLIGLLARTRASQIVLAGHSMGAFLVMEALRQRAIRNSPGSFDKTPLVVLMAPDIDVGVFRRQAEIIASRGVSFYVFTSTRDRALRLSAALRGSGVRLGAVADESLVSDLPVTVIDLSEVNGNEDSLNHFKVATSPVMISMMQGLSIYGVRIFADTIREPGPLQAGLGVVQDVTSIARP